MYPLTKLGVYRGDIGLEEDPKDPYAGLSTLSLLGGQGLMCGRRLRREVLAQQLDASHQGEAASKLQDLPMFWFSSDMVISKNRDSSCIPKRLYTWLGTWTKIEIFWKPPHIGLFMLLVEEFSQSLRQSP